MAETEALVALIRAETGQFQQELRRMTATVEQQGRQMEQGFKRVSSAADGIGRAIGQLKGLLAGLGLAVLARDAINTATNMDSLHRAFNAAAGDAAKGVQQWEFVRQESQRLGLELVSTATAYKGLLAATVSADKPIAAAQVIFRGVAEAATAMGLSVEDAKLTLLAVQQIMSKGTVQAEELRGQLGERFPVAVGVMAKALGKSTAELNKLMEQGRLTRDSLVIFAQELTTRYATAATQAAEGPRAAFNRFFNAITDVKEAIGTALLPTVQRLAVALTDLASSVTKNQEVWKAFGTVLTETVGWLQQAGEIVAGAARNIALAPLEKKIAATREEITRLQKELETAGQLQTGPKAWWQMLFGEPGEAVAPTQQLEQHTLRIGNLQAQLAALEKEYQAILVGATATTQAQVAQTKTTQELGAEIGKLVPIQEDAKKATQEAEHARKEAYDLAVSRGKAYLERVEDQEAADKKRFDAMVGEAKKEVAMQDELLKAGKEYIDQQFELRKAGIETSGALQDAAQDYLAQLQFIGVEERDLAKERTQLAVEVTRVQRREQETLTRETQRALEKQAEAWQHFAEKVQDVLADKIFDVFTGKIKSLQDLLGSLKDTFLRVLAEMAAKAAAGIVLNLVTQTVSGISGGAGGTGGGGAGGTASSVVQGLQQLFGGAKASGAFGGGFQAGTTATGEALGFGQGGTYIQTGQGWAAMLPGETASTFGYGGGGSIPTSGGAVGQFQAGNYGGAMSSAAGGIGLGISTGYAMLEVNKGLGMGSGPASRALAGAAGGAVAGTMIMPGIGTAVGAVLGAILGGLIHGKTTPFLDVKTSKTVIDLQNDLLTIMSLNIKSTGKGLPGAMTEVSQAIADASKAILQPTLDAVNKFSPAIRQSLLGQIQKMAQTFDTLLAGADFELAEKQGTEAITQFLTQKLPALAQQAFKPLVEALNKLQPIFNDMDKAVVTLQQQRQQLLTGLRGTRQGITEALQTPARIFESRRQQLTDMMFQWRMAPNAQMIQMVPQIQQLIAEVFQRGMAPEVFGGDPATVKTLQTEMLGLLDELEHVSTKVLDNQIAIGQHQLEILGESLGHLASIDQVLSGTKMVLTDLAAFMTTAFAGRFQSGGIVPQTGWAMVHRGEQVLPVGQTSNTIHITVNGGGHGDGPQLAAQIRDQVISGLESRSRLQQTRLDSRLASGHRVLPVQSGR